MSDPSKIAAARQLIADDSHPEVQPRMASWLVSLGRPVSPESAHAALRELGSWSFAAFIDECKNIALARNHGVNSRGGITSHSAFTAICEIEARWRRIGSSLAEAPASLAA